MKQKVTYTDLLPAGLVITFDDNTLLVGTSLKQTKGDEQHERLLPQEGR
jgi:hypothetical protein